MCLTTAKLAGAVFFRTRHSSSRKTMSMTQCRSMTQCSPFSLLQWPRMAALRVSALAAVEADVEAGLALDLGAGLDADLAYGFDHNNAPGPGPVVAFLQPSDFVRRRGGPGFDAAVALLHCLVVADNRIGKAACYLFDEEKLGIVVQAALVALEGKDIVGVLVDDLRGDVALTAHGVDGHRRAVDGQQIQQLRESDDLVGFISHLGLAKHQVLTCAPRRDHVDALWRRLPDRSAAASCRRWRRCPCRAR